MRRFALDMMPMSYPRSTEKELAHATQTITVGLRPQTSDDIDGDVLMMEVRWMPGARDRREQHVREAHRGRERLFM